ncbi:MAG: hypothetical protein ABSC93_32010, partial [Bryobacteraceae bacterium]|jgi:hypothetical protein
MAKRILILLILAGVLVGPEDLSSCGPFLPEAVFTSKLQPLDEARFFSGRLDILQPRYRRIYLMTAYRYFTGLGLGKQDQQELLAKPDTSTDMWMGRASLAVQGWLQVRVQMGAPQLDEIDRFKILPDHSYILNCGDDAFSNASATMIDRSLAGHSHEDLRVWVAAQDQVFGNCSVPQPWQQAQKPAGPSIPAPLPASAAAWMQADRAYQIASAEFYAGQFDAATADFLRIAADRSSPWHGIAPYLAARALIRKATVVDPSAAPAAQEQLRKALADPDAAAWHASARGLSRYLRVRTDPAGALHELALAVSTEKTGAARDMYDFRLILDRSVDTGTDPPDDITEWIAAMQNGPADRALVKWRQKRSLPWLVAAMTYAAEPDAELMAAAAKIAETSPAFPTVEFHRLRLMPADEARPRLDALLHRKMPVSPRNLFLAERLRVARDWDEFLRYAPRTMAATWVEGGGEEAATVRAVDFDGDASAILDRQAPLALLALAARSPSLPPNLQFEVARAVWVRAVLLGDNAAGIAIAPVLASLAPYLKPYLDRYQAAPDDPSRAFAAAWLMLNNPGMRPSIEAGLGRATPITKIDGFRDNWWCPVGATPNDRSGSSATEVLNAPLMLLYQGGSVDASFLSAVERAEARREAERLAAAPAAASLMARQAVEWVEAHPDDSRAPEALRLAVRAGHYACGGDGQTERWMKRAFRLLHSRYPRSEAAVKTPYWYSPERR